MGTEDAWREFDQLVAEAERGNPWRREGLEAPTYQADLGLLKAVLGVPLRLALSTSTGAPAKAVDVWLAHELPRTGFDADEVWPRPVPPRVLSRELATLLAKLPTDLAFEVRKRLEQGKVGSAVSTDARVLGKAYMKQVDVVVAHWSRGPEILISTKRMGSSLSNNALNRIEESYGDAHNLRGRHPLAAIGYVLVLRSSAIAQAPGPARRLMDLVAKMADEPEGYDASCVLVVDWQDDMMGVVRLDVSASPKALQPEAFLAVIIGACLNRTPVDLHVRARELREHRSLPVVDADD